MSNKIMLAPKDVTKGMYVAELDRPWLDSPFLFQGFRVTNADEISKLNTTCDYVFIDPDKSSVDVPRNLTPISQKSVTSRAAKQINADAAAEYEVVFEEELPRAKEIYKHSIESMDDLFNDVRSGRRADVKQVKYTAGMLMESVLRNPDALLLLTTLKDQNEESLIHATNVATLSMILGRYMGMDKSDLIELGTGALVHDIGEIRVPQELLVKRGKKTPEEQKILRDHVHYGVAILSKSNGFSDNVISITQNHHERTNGSGYPGHLFKNQISNSARLIAIADVYDKLTSGLHERRAILCTDVIKNMYALRKQLFDAQLVELFIQCLGIYPVGSVVKQNNGDVGIVISVDPKSRLHPKLMLVRNAEADYYSPPKILNLALFISEANKHKYDIAHVVNPTQYGIDTRQYILGDLLRSPN